MESQTQLITNVKQGSMLMLRFLADATLTLHIGDLHEEVHCSVFYEHPTFDKASASLREI
jgi:hypothetical protein